MSDHSLPKTVEPLKYADQNRVLEGFLSLDQLPRLVELLLDDKGQVETYLEFDRDEQGLRILKGKLSSEVVMTCERCLEPVKKTVTSNFVLGLALTDEDAKQLPRHYEPLLVEPESLDVAGVVEEELILSLPMFAYHDDCESGYVPAAEEQNGQADDGAKERENPFSVLSGLKVKK